MPTTKQIERSPTHLRKITLGEMKIAPLCQRELVQSWVDRIVAEMDLDQLGWPVVSERDGCYYIMDGQHRAEALKKWYGAGWETIDMECFVYTGLTEKQEAETFLKLNDKKTVNTFQKFKVSVRAGRTAECQIYGIVERVGLKVSMDSMPGSVGAVGTLKKVFKRDGSLSLERALRICRDAWGDPGLKAIVIEGAGLLCHRYNGVLKEETAIQALSKAHGGVNGLLGKAEQLRQKTGNSKAHCVAAAAVDIINANRKGTKKIPSWWAS